LPDNGSRPADRYAEHLDELPVQLVVLVERAALVTTVSALDNSGFVPGASIYPFVQNIVLGLRAEGLGTVLNAGLTPVESGARALLQVPDTFLIAAHLGSAGRLDRSRGAASVGGSRSLRHSTSLEARRWSAQATQPTP